jgi:hypothetical protein
LKDKARCVFSLRLMAQSNRAKMALFHRAILQDIEPYGEAATNPMTSNRTAKQFWIALTPALTSLLYPIALRAAHSLYKAQFAAGQHLAAILLVIVSVLPGVGLWLGWKGGSGTLSSFEHRARRFALVALAAPPLFVLLAFLLSVADHPIPELVAWTAMWVGAFLCVWCGPEYRAPPVIHTPKAAARMVHGVSAALLVLFIAYHLVNHSLGWLGPEAHAQFMNLGRKVYRLPILEAGLVMLLLGQICLGAWLAYWWTSAELDGFKLIQVATGVYLGFFVLTHMNSALLSARRMHGVDTDWAWASGMPAGLLGDDWNIRLVPHYLLGVFCVLAHLVCGLRGVMLAHDWRRPYVDRMWTLGLVGAVLVSLFIVIGLTGLRL